MDPVTLGLCSQIDLDLEVHRASKEKPVDVEAQGATLLPASETTIRREPEPEEKKPAPSELNVDAVFAKLKQIGGGKSEWRVRHTGNAAPWFRLYTAGRRSRRALRQQRGEIAVLLRHEAFEPFGIVGDHRVADRRHAQQAPTASRMTFGVCAKIP